MITIIHGGHREGRCYKAAKHFVKILISKDITTKFFNLRDHRFDYCCGDQPCQDSGQCIHDDWITREVIPTIARSDAMIIFTPTYFNMPPAILTNFINRCNLLLTINERKHLCLGAWITGQTSLIEKSVEACFNCISMFGDICDFSFLKNGKLIHAGINPDQIYITENDIKELHMLAEELQATNERHWK